MIDDLELSRKIYSMDFFNFENGEILKDVKVEYSTVGTPKFDKNGRIINAILYCHGSSGDCESVKKIHEFMAPGEIFDLEKYYFISLSGLGSPNSCSPSTTNLNNDFPKYEVIDLVNFQKKFLADCFNINHLFGLIGNSMGGFVVLTWATEYPDFMDFIISMVSSYKTAGHNYILSKTTKEIIESDQNYGLKDFEKNCSRTLKLACQAAYCYGFSREMYRQTSNQQLSQDFEEFGQESLSENIYDINFSNNATLDYDIEDKLCEIKVPVLIIAINQDQYFPPNLDAIPMSKMIKDSTLVIYDSELGHVGSNEVYKIKEDIENFIHSV